MRHGGGEGAFAPTMVINLAINVRWAITVMTA